MKPVNYLFIFSIISALFLSSCSDDDDTPTLQNLQFEFTGLENLGSDYVYEGWLIVKGNAISAGTFTVDDNGKLSRTQFAMRYDDLILATAYVLTIEPANDTDPAPSSVHILAGDFKITQAKVTTSHASALGTDFTAAKGKYILATPTDDLDTNENSGVWFVDPAAGKASLELPTLPKGWEYEGWAVINGVPVSTGKFTSATGADSFNGFSGSKPGPAFPGEDFLTNAPSGLTFPTDLSESTIVISVEPSPDNSPNPFSMKPLVGNVPKAAAVHQLFDMTNNAAATNPSGTVTRPTSLSN